MLRKAAFVAGFVAAAAASVPAYGQATRTWVSGVGDDVNPCSRTAPCKTFAGAISKTAAGGAINCLDSGGFGAVTITKSMTISCEGVTGGVLAGGNGITVNAGPNDSVFLSGLDFHGVSPPQNGVRFVAGGRLHIHRSTIRKFVNGVSFAPTGASQLVITHSIIADNGNGTNGGGIVIAPGTAGVATVTIVNSTVSGNSAFGIGATGAGASVAVGDSTITGHRVGLVAESGAKLMSFGGNRVHGNQSDGTFSGNVAAR